MTGNGAQSRSLWMATTAVPAFGPLAEDARADVCVVGAGIAGMTTAYLRSEGGEVHRDLFGLSLEWPDGSKMERVSFHSRDAQDRGMQHVSLEDNRIRELVQKLPRVVVTEPIPCLRFVSLPAEVVGYWSLWRISLDGQNLRDAKVLPLFLHDEGRVYLPTARSICPTVTSTSPSCR